MNLGLEKGNLLEKAVTAIEKTILASSPGFNEKTFSVENKKLVKCDGVMHEVDLFVTVDVARDYQAIFIFECKNWEEKVGKNEIIVFSEKVNVTNAQKGFFVARSFTKDAVKQAEKDPRISLLLVESLPTENIPVPLNFHSISVKHLHTELSFEQSDAISAPKEKTELKITEILLDNKNVELGNLVENWAKEISTKELKTFPSGSLSAGVYPLSGKGRREFNPGQFYVNNIEMKAVVVNLDFEVEVVYPTVISHFDVKTRGRTFHLSPVQVGNGSLQITLVQT